MPLDPKSETDPSHAWRGQANAARALLRSYPALSVAASARLGQGMTGFYFLEVRLSCSRMHFGASPATCVTGPMEQFASSKAGSWPGAVS